MSKKPAPKPTPEAAAPLTPVIIAGLQPGQEFGDPDHKGLRVRCTATGKKVFSYRYGVADKALREIKLGEFGAVTLAGARKALAKARQDR